MDSPRLCQEEKSSLMEFERWRFLMIPVGRPSFSSCVLEIWVSFSDVNVLFLFQWRQAAHTSPWKCLQNSHRSCRSWLMSSYRVNMWLPTRPILMWSNASLTRLVCVRVKASNIIRKSPFWTLQNVPPAKGVGGMLIGSSWSVSSKPDGANSHKLYFQEIVALLLVREALCSTLNFPSVCQVSVEFSSTSAVPGEETTLKVTALPDSLCGVSAIDQSVLIKEPGKTLTTDRVGPKKSFFGLVMRRCFSQRSSPALASIFIFRYLTFCPWGRFPVSHMKLKTLYHVYMWGKKDIWCPLCLITEMTLIRFLR